MRLLLAATVALLVVSPAMAQVPDEHLEQFLSNEFSGCARLAPNQFQRGRCFTEERMRQEALLGADMRIAQQNGEAGQRALLAAAQRAWEAYAQADCRAQMFAGTSAGIMIERCRLAHVLARRQALRRG